jgi:phosphoribosylformylglycinamidine synthase
MERRGCGMVKTCIVTGYGINADIELETAFRKSGAEPRRIHINDLIQGHAKLSDYQILGIPGGFSFGDHLGSGKVFAALFKANLRSDLREFVAEGKPVIGICNGFQVLVKMGILPNLSGSWVQESSLVHNDSGVFEDRWVRVTFNPDSPCLWTQGIDEAELPVRHGEGKFITAKPEILQALEEKNLVALRYRGREEGVGAGYPHNPNGSVRDIAGICDPTGRVFGLMPHPEAYIHRENHPRWTREDVTDGGGLAVFRNAVEYCETTFRSRCCP